MGKMKHKEAKKDASLRVSRMIMSDAKQSSSSMSSLIRGLLREYLGSVSIHSLAMTSSFLFFSLMSFAQPIEIIRDPRVDVLVSRYKEVHQKKESIEGFRIQITAGSNRTAIYQTKSKFYTLFPKVTQYLIYQAPNFKLRVGNYRTKLEAFKDLQKFMPDFNGAFIIRDEIKISEL